MVCPGLLKCFRSTGAKYVAVGPHEHGVRRMLREPSFKLFLERRNLRVIERYTPQSGRRPVSRGMRTADQPCPRTDNVIQPLRLICDGLGKVATSRGYTLQETAMGKRRKAQ